MILQDNASKIAGKVIFECKNVEEDECKDKIDGYNQRGDNGLFFLVAFEFSSFFEGFPAFPMQLIWLFREHHRTSILLVSFSLLVEF